MSTISSINVTNPSSIVTGRKSSVSQIETSQPQQNAAASSVTISSSGAVYADYLQDIAQKESGRTIRQMALEDPNNPYWAQAAEAYVTENMSSGNVGGLLRLTSLTVIDAPITYTNGEPVTVASQAYYEKQTASYMNQVRELYDTERAKGTAPGQIVAAIIDLQAKQPEAFRAMNAWPPASGPSSIRDATNTSGTTPQYLNAGGQVINSSSLSSSNYDNLLAQDVARKREQVLLNVFDTLISSLDGSPDAATGGVKS